MRRSRSLQAPAAASIFAIAITALACFVPARPASAQTLEAPDARQGYFLVVGPQFTLTKVWMDDEKYGIWPGYDFGLHFGQMVTRHFGLGLLVHNGAAKGNGQTAGTFGLGLEAQVEVARRLAIHGAAGVETIQVRADDGSDKSLRGTAGAGYTLGVSYSWFLTHRLSGGWALTPRLDVRYVPGSTSSGLTTVLGIQIAWWTGLPRNQLELPASEAYKTKKK
ncbi:MAG TPA: hypothetical protein VIU64_11995 [Polyangia bacterium]